MRRALARLLRWRDTDSVELSDEEANECRVIFSLPSR
jgi:hypothetical protein